MPAASQTNLDSAGGTILPLQTAVLIDGDPWAIVGSPVAAHPPCPDPAIHCAAHMIEGSSHVFIEGIPVCRQGDEADCGHAATGRPWKLIDLDLFEEIRAEILASTGIADKDKLLLCLPDQADEIASFAESECDAQGWIQLWRFLRKWFVGAPSTDRTARRASYIDWDWLLCYERVAEAWADLAKPMNLFNSAGKFELQKILAKQCAFEPRKPGRMVAFDHITTPESEWHGLHFQHVEIGYPHTSQPDGLTASMGRFSIYALAKGQVEHFKFGYEITVSEVAFFVRDSFDFEGSQWLYDWECPANGLAKESIFNSDFRTFRENNQKGGDFYVFSAPRIVPSANYQWNPLGF